MKIEKYTKLKSGQYKLSLEDGSCINLHEDLILKHNLLITKEISNEDSIKLQEENTSYLAYDLAIKYLNTKMRTKKEIREYLLKKEIKETYIADAIKILEKQGYLNDEIYIKAYINDKINLSSDGPYKIKEQLLKLGINEEVINKYIVLFTKEEESNRIQHLIDKQIRTNHNKSGYILKKKINDYLVNLGYSKDLIIKYINNIKIDDSDIRKKEYDKIYKKLSKKYTGKELEYKIKQKMYQKGFYSNYE